MKPGMENLPNHYWKYINWPKAAYSTGHKIHPNKQGRRQCTFCSGRVEGLITDANTSSKSTAIGLKHYLRLKKADLVSPITGIRYC